MSLAFNDRPLSVLDLSPIRIGGNAGTALRETIDLARHVESLGYNRFWLAEHHNMPGIASSATSVVIGQVAAATERMRIGSGGVMLSNHAPLLIAEQFGTLEALFPGRIDLGLGRAPGTDQVTVRALRREVKSNGLEFPEQLAELRAFFEPATSRQAVRATPGAGATVPIWLLGSSGFSAELAGMLGLPFAFAAHFSPEVMLPALRLYRQSFQPSSALQTPYAMVCLNVIAADTTERARYLSTSHQQAMLALARGTPTALPPPVRDMDAVWSPQERSAMAGRLGGTITGDPSVVRTALADFVEATAADELMIHTMVYDHRERLHSYELLARLAENVPAESSAACGFAIK